MNAATKHAQHQSATRRVLVRAGLALLLMSSAPVARGQSSDGSDGVYAPSGPPGTVVIFDATQFHGSQVASNTFNFTQISIPVGVTVKFRGDVLNGPVFWLAQGAVTIEGTLDLNGGPGHPRTNNAFTRVASIPGSGGYAGGAGGSQFQAALPGSGPAGATFLSQGCGSTGQGGAFSGNRFLIPLVGGSGGRGGWDVSHGEFFDPGGGAGGGAILIATMSTITVNGTITANGGDAPPPSYCYSGGGAGGAVRLVAATITGAGTITANGGRISGCPQCAGGPGQIRLEASTNTFTGTLESQSPDIGATNLVAQSTPFPLLLPTAGPPSARVISVAGVAINPNGSFPDITINTATAVPVVIQTHNVPITAAINLTILNQNSVADTVIQAPPVGACDSNNFCTTMVNVIFPFGASRTLTRVTWTQ